MYTLTNGSVFTGETQLKNHSVIVDGTTILDVLPSSELPTDMHVIDLKGHWIVPGFIDIQVNGGGGVLFNDQPTEQGIQSMVQAHQQYGTTCLLPTLITSSAETMKTAIAAVEGCINKNIPGILGIHLEGPYISPIKAGVHHKPFIRPLLDKDIKTASSLKNGITLITVAPEAVSPTQITDLKKRSVIVSLGHSNCTFAQAEAAFSAGATGVTHLHNAMSPLTARAPGLVGAGINNPAVWIGIIADGHHVDFETVKLSVRAKTAQKTILVTDAMSTVGSSQSAFQLGDYSVQLSDGKLQTVNGKLAGSALNMATAVRNCIQKANIPVCTAFQMAATHPAQFLGQGHRLGKLKKGYIANATILNKAFETQAIVVQGKHRPVDKNKYHF